MEIIISILLMVIFFRFLGFLIRAGFKILGFLLSIAATLIVFALPLLMIGAVWESACPYAARLSVRMAEI